MSDCLNITTEEWKQELDKLRQNEARYHKFTEEQWEFLEYARDKKPPVSWKNIEKLWNKHTGWPKVKYEYLRRSYTERRGCEI